MTYLIALQLRIKHRAFPWWYCMSLARQERKGIPEIDWDGITKGLVVCFLALLVMGVWR